jgi:hypothetical protein
MSNKLRVNLQFGSRADPDLLEELRSLPPYRRASFARQLISKAWRARSAPPPLSDSYEKRPVPPPQAACLATTFEDELLSGLGSVLNH